MDFFQLDGIWWRPESPGLKQVGTLSMDSDQFSLIVDGSIESDTQDDAFPGLPEWRLTPVIFGRDRKGEEITLFGAQGANWTGPQVSESDYSIRFAIFGSHSLDGTFTEARVEFDSLSEWADPPSIIDHTDDPREILLHFRSLDIAEASVNTGSVKLVSKAVGSVSGEEVSLKRRVFFVLNHEPSSVAEVLESWVRPLQDLLTLAIGRPLRITGIYVGQSMGGELARLTYEAVQALPSSKSKGSHLLSYSAPTLLTLANSPLSFDRLIPQWFALRLRIREVLVLLHAPHYAKSMFNEHRYSVTFQSAEVLADMLGYSGREKAPAEHKLRVKGIVEAAIGAGVSEEDTSWARRILTSRNDKPLRNQISDLVAFTPVIGPEILAAVPNFGAVAAAARTGVSHGGAAATLSAAGREWLLQVIQWVVRCRVLIELGIHPDEAGGRASERAGFKFALERLQEELAESLEVDVHPE